jgi:hypothetical protein
MKSCTDKLLILFADYDFSENWNCGDYISEIQCCADNINAVESSVTGHCVQITAD